MHRNAADARSLPCIPFAAPNRWGGGRLLAEADGNRTRRGRVAAPPIGFEVRAGHQHQKRFRCVQCTRFVSRTAVARRGVDNGPCAVRFQLVSAYTLGDAARICGISRQRLRYWKRTALLKSSSPESGEQTAFDFRGLVSVRSIVGLLEGGVPLQRIRSSVSEVRECIPDLDALPALHAWGGRGRVVVQHDGRWMETSGQLLLDLAVPEGGGVEHLEDHEPESRSRRVAEGWFERGCDLDTESATYEEAAEAYRQAIEIAPDFADAHCNLGSVYFNQDSREKAKACFQQAIELEPGHVEANLNLGAIREEEGADESALRHYRAALETDPLYADVHVSLALVYEKLTLVRTARAHWRRYLQLDPKGAWAELARRRVAAG